MKIISIVGTRPQFVEMVAIHKAILKYLEIEHIILHTGQYYDNNMSKIFLKNFRFHIRTIIWRLVLAAMDYKPA